ncbi:MAG: hypothetical protein WA191_00930, partial [Telluria sp.]
FSLVHLIARWRKVTDHEQRPGEKLGPADQHVVCTPGKCALLVDVVDDAETMLRSNSVKSGRLVDKWVSLSFLSISKCSLVFNSATENGKAITPAVRAAAPNLAEIGAKLIIDIRPYLHEPVVLVHSC